MNYKIFENRLKYLKKTYGPELWNMTVTANKIEGKAFLILKNENGKVSRFSRITVIHKHTAKYMNRRKFI